MGYKNWKQQRVKANKQKLLDTTHWHRQQCGGYRGKGGLEKVNKVKSMMTEKHLTLGGRNTTRYTDDVSSSCTLETCIILLTNVNPMNWIEEANTYLLYKI